MLAATAGAVPALVALDRDPLTFAALPARLAAVRDALAAAGIGSGDRVAGVLPRGPETAVCFLGVASCATYVALNPRYTAAEFARYLTRIRPKALILPSGEASAARDCAVQLAIPVVELEIDAAKPAGTFSLRVHGCGAAIEPRWNTANDVALVLLTSGTTAEQKLVPVRQRHLLAYARASGDHYRLTAADRGLHVMPMFHGHGLKSALFVPLACGSGVICSRDFDIPSFFRQIVEWKPTWYSAASSFHHAILGEIGAYHTVAREAGLRFIRSGSSRLDPKVMAGLEAAFGAPVVERYGMSETCTLASNPLPPEQRKPGSVGRPMFNEVKIVDEHGSDVDPGGVGEIVARGPGVFDGYLDDDEATRAAFYGPWFRTGDLGSFDTDGFLTLAGRVKDVINRGGEKIGTTEVESALLRHPAVAEACAFAHPHPSLGEEVVAAIVRAPGMHVSERDLQAHMRRLLAGFKVPRRISLLPVLPKTAAGKTDRAEVARLCAALLADAARLRVDACEPRWTPLEREIAELWSRMLGIAASGVGRDDDFFLLGGDSLQAYELFAALRERYDVRLGLGRLFDDAATVPGMARLVESGRRRAAGPRSGRRLVRISDGGERPPLFAIPGSGGNPVGYVHLGRLLAGGQPLIGIESRGIDGSTAPLYRVEDIAADNLVEVRRVQSAGPYFLAGACYGARVAYEMARQLEAAGERVGLLLMLDPSSPFHRADGAPRGNDGTRKKTTSPRRDVLSFVFDRLVLYASTFARLGVRERIAFIREKARLVRQIVQRRDLFRGDRTELDRRRVYAANRDAGSRYTPGPFAGHAVVCFTRDRPVRGERNHRLDWLELLPQSGGPRYVGGNDSGQMLEIPHVYELAVLINRCLDEAIAREDGAAGALEPANAS